MAIVNVLQSDNVEEHKSLLHQELEYEVKGLVFEVELLDVKKIFGRIEYLITPVKGSGEVWVVGSK
jgi:hypothetical protein